VHSAAMLRSPKLGATCDVASEMRSHHIQQEASAGSKSSVVSTGTVISLLHTSVLDWDWSSVRVSPSLSGEMDVEALVTGRASCRREESYLYFIRASWTGTGPAWEPLSLGEWAL